MVARYYASELKSKRSWKTRSALAIVVAVSAVALLLFGVWYALRVADFFRVEHLELRGLQSLSQEEFLAALTEEMFALHPWLKWIGSDRTLFWEFGGTPSRFTTFPRISRVVITTDLFSRNVIITVEERNIHGILCRRESCYGFDERGVVFAEAPSVSGNLILKIEDEDENAIPIILGAQMFEDVAWFVRLRDTADVVRRAGFSPFAFSVKDRSLREWNLTLREGPTLFFSFNFVPENLETVLRTLSVQPSFSNLVYIDFRVPNRVYYR